MKNHSIGCLCLNYYFIPPFQSLPNLFLNLFLLFERKSIGKHLSIYLTPTSEVFRHVQKLADVAGFTLILPDLISLNKNPD
jgi:hypothetical protein